MQNQVCDILDIAISRTLPRKQRARTGDIEFGRIIEGHFVLQTASYGASGSNFIGAENVKSKRYDLRDAVQRSQLLMDIQEMAATRLSYGDRRIAAYRSRGWGRSKFSAP
ncbi:hypothetical protein [Rhizobium sp. P44RR-XXIV]|uniref:hypothetical protein n=1 Tax=Rhizobium sp. P44RR-XXIV TaxID=1921145 RepID=UPI0010AA0214|nr:hypothetical protein [Rhizobium sp. P44RR-XXIV]TIX90504.1 hypothetical protein BSK43_014630 [Rhizobium sp. P44RR-XXIV]